MADQFSLDNPAKTGKENSQELSSEKYQILIVDDEPNILQAIKRMLRKDGYRITTAADGLEALEIMAGQTFHLIISDHMMPGMNGSQLLQRVKELYPDTVRIMLTGHADKAEVGQAIAEDALYRFIPKPVNDDELRTTIESALKQYEIIQKNRELQENNIKQSREIEALSRLAAASHSQLPTLLHKNGLLHEARIEELYTLHKKGNTPIIKLILEKNLVHEKRIREIIGKELKTEYVSLPKFQVAPEVTELIPGNFCRKQLVLPLRMKSKRQLLLAAADPTDQEMLENIQFITGLQIETVQADVNDLENKIAAVYGREGNKPSIRELETVVPSVDPMESIEIIVEQEEDISIAHLFQQTEEPTAIRLANAIIIDAIKNNASDIHIQPGAKFAVVRYRLDGILFDKIKVKNAQYKPLVSRLKIMAELDISEKRKPQDGRISVKSPLKIIDMRISTMPTIYGEKVVMRLLDRNSAIQSIDSLGFLQANLDKVLNLIDIPQGIILATGPTGSGKTTTLYSLLQHNATSQKNYVTLEDPVEYYMDGAAQVAVREKIGLDFAAILRATLRQDPDVILLGEIRDRETADVAFQAALTGHQVYSSLHTNSAIETIMRLFDLQLRPYIISSALLGVISQRLVRKNCQHCLKEVEVSPDLQNRLGPAFEPGTIQTFQGEGCRQCGNSGYSGRYPLQEVFVVSENIKELISSSRSAMEIKRAASAEGLLSLAQDAGEKVNQGYTTVSEVLRVLGPQP